MTYQVAIQEPFAEDGALTTGTVDADTLNGEDANDWIGQELTVSLYDENGCYLEATGRLVEVFCVVE